MAPAREPQEILGAAIRRLRLDAGLSQEALALRAGLHPTGLSKIENGHSNPAWGTVRRISVALEASLGELVSIVERIEVD